MAEGFSTADAAWLLVLQHIQDKDRPDEAFTTDRAVRAGRANAASGRIMVTVPGDHFGPIPAEADPRGQVWQINIRPFLQPVVIHWERNLQPIIVIRFPASEKCAIHECSAAIS